MKVYRELFFNNIDGMLAANFPVIRRIFGDDDWHALVRAFYRDHRSRTPLFTELPREFLRYLETRDVDRRSAVAARTGALRMGRACAADQRSRPATTSRTIPTVICLSGRPLPSPLAWPLAYAWPVHRIGPDYQPEVAPREPTLLLLRREADGKVSFHSLSPLTFRLLQRLDLEPALSGREQLAALAVEAGAEDIDAFMRDGAAMLLQLHREGTLLGTQSVMSEHARILLAAVPSLLSDSSASRPTQPRPPDSRTPSATLAR